MDTADKKLSQAELIVLLDGLAQDIIAKEEELRQLDAALGDGDLGITTRMGFKAVQAIIHGKQAETNDIGALLGAAGIAFSNANASTMGALMGTAFMRAGKAGRGKTELDLAEVAQLCRAALDGILQRGKAHRGDKTILDALFPACESLEEAASAKIGWATAFAQAAQAAQAGVVATTPLQSQVSRAAWLQERSKGHPDPGASLCYFIFDSLATRLQAL